MRRKQSFLLITILPLLAMAASAVLLKGCAQKADSLETVRIGAATQPVAGLVYIADEKGFFKQRGVNAIVKTYETGSLALDALLAGAVDIATATEFVLARQSLDHNNLRAFGQIANTKNMELIVRKDRGINKVSDLKGKRIGLPRGSISEFSLGVYLRHNNIPFSDVEIVDLAPSAIEEAFYNGSVDGVVIWEPHVTRIKKRFESNATIWPIQGRDDYYFLLVTTEAFLRRSPATAAKMLRAVIDAEGLVDKHPEQVSPILESRINYAPGDVQLRLAGSTLKVRLDQGLLTGMEAEAQWMIRNNLTSKKEMPNYLNMIDLKPLEAVKPEAVGVIH